MVKILPKEERCQVEVPGTGPWAYFHRHQCKKRAVVVRGGIRYCTIHDPEYVKTRDKARTERYDKRWAHRKIELAGPMLLKACKDALEASHDPVVEKILMEAINKAERR